MDIRSLDSVSDVVADMAGRHYGIAALVCNAAGPHSSRTLLDRTPEDWDSDLDVNFRGPRFCVQQGAKAMIAGHRGVRAVALASIAAPYPYARRAHCSSSKARIIAMA